MGPALVASAPVVLAYMTGLFLLALVRRDNSTVDLGWGPGFLLVAVWTILRGPAPGPRAILAAALTAVWAARLSVHIAVRNRGRGEDFRYAAWRVTWGRWFVLRSYAQVFLFQGAVLLVVALPLIGICAAPAGPLGPLDALGAGVWLAGFLFESIADAELRRFKRRPGSAGRIMTTGLWRLSRHPNYFGEALIWWGLFLIARAAGAGWIAIAGPVTMTLLLRFVSGVPLLERRWRGRPEFEAYAARTNAFFPWPPRKRPRNGPSG